MSANSGVAAWVQRYNSSLGSDDQAYYAAADSVGNLIVAGYRYNGLSWNDIAVIKYSNAGQPLWTNLYTGPEYFASELNALAVDSAGNVFLGGFSRVAGSIDFLLLKYSSAGLPLWTNYYDGAAHALDRIWALAVDSSGDVIVTGESSESAAGIECVSIKYSGAGIPLWTNRSSSEAGYSIVVDSIDNVIVGASRTLIKYTGSGIPIWTNTSAISSYADPMIVDENDDILVIGDVRSLVYPNPITYSIVKYSSTGPALWTNQFGGPDYLFPNLDLHPSGNILASTSATNASDGGYNFFLTALSTTGDILWSTPCEGIAAISCGPDGKVFTAGGFGHATTAYAGDGLPLWTNRFGGNTGTGDIAAAVVVSGDKVFSVGWTLNKDSHNDFTSLAYNGDGVPVWTNWYHGGPANHSDIAQALVVGPDGSVVVTGSSRRLAGENDDFATIKYAPTGQPLWTNWYSGPGSNNDRPTAIARDGDGNVIVVGQSITTDIATDSVFVTVKLSAAGVPLWTNSYRRIPGGIVNVSQAAAVDGENSVYVTGYSHGGSSFYDFATIKYSAAGVPQWTNRYNTPLSNSDDRPTAIAVDDSNTVYVTGYGPSTLGGDDFITLAYSNTGAALWTNRYHLTGANNGAVDIAVDASGNILVTGYSRTNSQTSYDFATIKYTSSGTALWTNRYNGPANGEDRPVALATDAQGNVIVTGYSTNSTTGLDFTTVKYSGAGAALWTNRFDGPGHAEDRPVAVAVDAIGNVVVTGSARTGSSLPTTDFVTVKYSSSGSLLWAATYNGPINDYDSPMSKACLGIATDGSVYVTGESDGSFTTSRTYDFATIKYVEISPIQISQPTVSNGLFGFSFTNTPSAPFSVWTATNATTTEWMALGGLIETAPGYFDFIDSAPATNHQRFYRVSSP